MGSLFVCRGGESSDFAQDKIVKKTTMRGKIMLAVSLSNCAAGVNRTPDACLFRAALYH